MAWQEEADLEARGLQSAKYQPLEQEILPRKTESKLWRLALRSAGIVGAGVALMLLYHLFVIYLMPLMVSTSNPATQSGMVYVHGSRLILVRESSSEAADWQLPGRLGIGAAYTKSIPAMPLAVTAGNADNGEIIFMSDNKNSGVEYHAVLRNVTSSRSDFLKEVQAHVQGADRQKEYKWVKFNQVNNEEHVGSALHTLFTQSEAREQLGIAVQLLTGSTHGLAPKIKKLGAGLFLKAEGDILLLRKNSSNNNATLCVPGGNSDLTDQHLRHTAEREAVEEMGKCPNYTYKGEIDTRRGKDGSKVFKMFVGELAAEYRYNFHPVLSHESLEWGWYPLKDLHKRKDLHPTVKILVVDHAKKVAKIFSK